MEERKGCLTGDNGNTGGRLDVIQMHLISHCMRKGLVGEWHVLVCGRVTRRREGTWETRPNSEMLRPRG